MGAANKSLAQTTMASESASPGVLKLKSSDVSFGDLTDKNVGQMRMLNEFLYPIRYQDKFYTDILVQHEWSQYVFLRDVLVGAICCRLEPTDEGFKLYVLTLGVLEAYRRLGLADRMLAHITAKAREQPEIQEIYLHVQDGNDAALAFYKKNMFDASEHLPDYYKNVTPTGATLLRKLLV